MSDMKRINKKNDSIRVRDIMSLLEQAQNNIIERKERLSKSDKKLYKILNRAWSDINSVWDKLNKALELDQ